VVLSTRVQVAGEANRANTAVAEAMWLSHRLMPGCPGLDVAQQARVEAGVQARPRPGCMGVTVAYS